MLYTNINKSKIMGKCMGKHVRVEHLNLKQNPADLYDKYGNLIAGGANLVEIRYQGRKVFFSLPVQVKYTPYTLKPLIIRK